MRLRARDTLSLAVLAAAALTGCEARVKAPPGGARALSGGGATMQKATFGAGCFWGVEAAFRQVEGVVSTQVGYAGGTLADPTYEQVCTDKTGHAEVVEVTFDPGKLSYETLLEAFWTCHDPTQVDRQGPDVGRQYRSVIFYHGEAQRAAAEASKARLAMSGKHTQPVATAIEPAPAFWRAEECHQQYLEKRGQADCRIQ